MAAAEIAVIMGYDYRELQIAAMAAGLPATGVGVTKAFLQEELVRRANPRPLRREELVDYMSHDERLRICRLHDLSARFGSNADMGMALKAYYRELEPPSLVKRIRVAVLRTFAAVAVMGLVMFGLGALHHSREVSAVTTQPCVGVVSDIVDRVDAGVPPSGWTSPTPAVGEHASVANSGSGLEGILALKYYEEDEEDVNETVASRFNVDAVVEPAFMPSVVDERAQTASLSRMTYVVEGDGDNDVIVEDIEDVAAPVDSMVEPVMIVEVVSKAAATTLSNEATAAVPPSEWTTPTPIVGERTSVADWSLDDIADPAFYAEEEHVDEAVSARFDVDAVVEAAVISGVADEEVQTASPSSMSNVVEVDGDEEITIEDIDDVAAPVDIMVEPVMIVEVVSKPAATTLLDEAAAGVPPGELKSPTPAVGERAALAESSFNDIVDPAFYEEEHVNEAVSARFGVDAVVEPAVISGVFGQGGDTVSPSRVTNVVEVNGDEEIIVEDIEDVAAPVDTMVEPVMIVEVVSKPAATILSDEATAAVPPSEWTTPTPIVGERTSVADWSLDDIADPAFYAEEEHVDEAVSARFDVDAVVEAAVISGVADEEVQTASPSSMSNVVEVDGDEEITIEDIDDVAAPVDIMVEPVMIVEVVSKPAATTLLDEAAAGDSDVIVEDIEDVAAPVDTMVEPVMIVEVVSKPAATTLLDEAAAGDTDVIVEDIEDVAAPVDTVVEPVMIVEVVSKPAATTLSDEATAAVPPSEWTTPTPIVGERTSVADWSLDDIADPAFYAEEEHVDEAVSARFDVDAVVEAAVISGVADEEVQTASPSSMSNVVEVDGEEEIIIKDIEDVAAPVDTMVEPVMIVEVVSKPAATTLLDEAAAGVPPGELKSPTPAVGERAALAESSFNDIVDPAFYEEEHVNEAVSARFGVDAVVEPAVISGVSPSRVTNVVEVNGELPSKIDAGICCPVSWCQVSDATYFRGTDSDKCGCSFNPTRMTSGAKHVPGVTTADYVAKKPVPASAVTRPTGKDGGGFSTTATREDSASLVPIAFVAEADPDNRALSGGSNADLAPLLQRMLEEQMAAAARGEALMARSMARSDLHFVVLCVLAIAVRR
eukprot:g15203.t1